MTHSSAIPINRLICLLGIGTALAAAPLPLLWIAASAGIGLLVVCFPALGLAFAAFAVPVGAAGTSFLGASAPTTVAITPGPILIALSALGAVAAALVKHRTTWTTPPLNEHRTDSLTEPLIKHPNASLTAPLTKHLNASLTASFTKRRTASLTASFTKRPSSWTTTPLLRPALLLIGAVAAAAWSAPDLGQAALEVVRWSLLATAMVLVATAVRTDRGRRVLFWILLLAGTAEALFGIVQVFSGVGPEAFAVGGRARAFGHFGQPNPFGGYMNLVWPMGAAWLLTWAGKRGAGVPATLLALTATTICLAGLTLSWSRGAWLGAAAGAVAMAGAWGLRELRERWSTRFMGLVWLGAMACTVLLLVGGLERVPASLGTRFSETASGTDSLAVADVEVTDANFATVERLAHWTAALAMWSDRPWLGQGPGHFALAYPRYRLPRWPEGLGHAHNIYLNFLAETGLVGLAAYLVFFGAAIWVALRTALTSRTAARRAIGLGVTGVLAALAVHSFFDNLYVHDMAIHLGLLLGLLVGRGEPETT